MIGCLWRRIWSPSTGLVAFLLGFAVGSGER